MAQQQFDDVFVTEAGSPVKRRVVVLNDEPTNTLDTQNVEAEPTHRVLLVDGNSVGGEQQLHDLRVTIPGGMAQRRSRHCLH